MLWFGMKRPCMAGQARSGSKWYVWRGFAGLACPGMVRRGSEVGRFGKSTQARRVLVLRVMTRQGEAKHGRHGNPGPGSEGTATVVYNMLMEPQAYDELKAATDKIKRVRDATTYGELERAIIIDVHATLRTVLAMYTESQPEVAPEPHKFSMNDLNPFKGN